MKITILKHGITNQYTFDRGVETLKKWTNAINFPLEITIKTVNFPLEFTTYDSPVVGKGTCVKPELILNQVDGTEDVACLVFGSKQGVIYNPTQHPIKKGNATPIQLSEQWYGVIYQDVMAQYLLHEICHAIYFLVGMSANDQTHNRYQNSTYNPKQEYEWYQYLISGLKPLWEAYKTKKSPSQPLPTTTTVLQEGSTGQAVVDLQKFLVEYGFLVIPKGIAYGTFAGLTKQAVMAFQKKYNLVSDGIVGSKTFAKINEIKKKSSVTKFGLLPLVERKALELINLCASSGTPIKITVGYRSIEDQNELYAQGRTKKGTIITNAKGGDSFHNYRVAFDVYFINEGYNGNWKQFRKIAKSLGFEWGGDWTSFPDKPHVQYTLGYTLNDFKQNKVDFSRFF